MLFIVYVDDGILMLNSAKLLKKRKTAFLNIWEAHDMGPVQEYLGFQITRNHVKHSMVLHQRPYVLKVLKHFRMENVKHVCTPLPAGYQPSTAPKDYNASPTTRQWYQSVIGSLLFVMLGTRPDIAFAIIKMSQFMANLTEEHLLKALHIVKYLGSTPNLVLHFSGGASSLDCYSDSDWAGDSEVMLSFLAMTWLAGDLANNQQWLCPQQRLSTCNCTQQILWIKSLFQECHLSLQHFMMFGDNKGTIHIVQNPVMEGRSKHIDIKYYFLREYVEKQTFMLDYVPTDQQKADMMMKNLTGQKFQDNRSWLNLLEFKS